MSRTIEADVKDGREIDDSDRRITVTTGPAINRVPLIEDGDEDLFAQPAEVFKTMEGLKDSVKKKASRAVTKMEKVHQGSVPETNNKRPGILPDSGDDGRAKSTKLEINNAITGYDMLGVVYPPYNLTYLAKLYSLSSPHYACVNVKAANVVGLGYDFIESPKTSQIQADATTADKTDKINKKLRKYKQIMLDWLDSCNEEDEFVEILRRVYIDYEATGNGYLEIGRTAGGEIGYIGHIPCTSMRVRRVRDGFVQIMSNKAVFFKHFGKKDTVNPITEDLNANEVIHFKKYNPSNSYYGLSDILAAMSAVAGNEFAARFNLDYFENKAIPRYVIIIKGATLSLGSQKEIVEFFETGLKGKNHRTLFVPLPADSQDVKTEFKMEPVEAGIQDASFSNYNKINLQSIFMAHRVPMSKVSISEGVSLAAARDAATSFKEEVCHPEQTIIEKKLSKIFKEKTDVFVFVLEQLTLTDEDTQSKIDQRSIQMQTIVPNEIRARGGHPPLEGGDKVVEVKPAAPAAAKGKPAKAATTPTKGAGNTRAQDRANNTPDSSGGTTGRNSKGEGRKTS